MIIKALILAALIKVLLTTNKPFLCAGIYAGVGFVLSLLAGTSLLVLVLATVLRFALASLYFWLLDRFEDSTGLFWLIAILGIFIGLV
jgi:hypothetical protein